MKLTEQTLIPLSLVGSIIGGVVWLSVIYYKSEATAKDVDQLKQYQLEVIHKLSRIETKLELIESKQ
jgi:hypothetical protein